MSLTNPSPSANFFFATYRLESNDRLIVRFVAEKAVTEAIKTGRLKGEVKESSLGNDVTITDDPARMATSSPRPTPHRSSTRA